MIKKTSYGYRSFLSFKKIFNYFSILTISFGSTFGTMNAANAVDLTITGNDTWNVDDEGNSPLDDGITGILTSPNINATTGAATLLIDTTASQMSATAVAIGDLTDSGDGVMGVNIVVQASFDAVATIGINSVNVDGAFDFEADNASAAAAQAMTLTVSADTSIGTTAGLDNNDSTDGTDLIMDMNGNLVVGAKASGGSGGGALTVVALGAAGSVVSHSTLKISGDLTAQGVAGAGVDAVVLDDIAAGTGGIATLEFDGTTAQTITGEIDGSGAKEGKLLISGTGTVASFSDKIGVGAQLRTIQVAAGAEAKFADIIDTVSLDIDNDITVSENNNVVGLSDAGSINIANSAIVTIDDTIAAGESVFKTDASDNTAGVVIGTGTHTLNLPSNFTSGTITYIDGADQTLTSTMVGDIIVTDTALTDYTVALASSDLDIAVTAAAKTEAATATELGITANDSRALKQASLAIGAGGNAAAVDALTNAMNATNGFSATEDTALAKQVAPQTDLISGSSVAAQGVTGSVQGIMSNRMASLRSGDAYFGTGVAAGGMSAESGFIQVFGSTAEQESKKVGDGTQSGFDTDSQGLAIGLDGVTDAGLTVGVSFATANTDVDGKGLGKSTNSIDTYSASLYMDTATENGYVEGSVTFGLNENTTSRIVNAAGTPSRTLTGSYDSNSISLNLAAGIPNEVGAGYLTPFGSFTATVMDIDPYTEKSTVTNDALRLKVAQDDVNSMVGTVGLKFHGEMSNGGVPMISVAINNEFGDNTINSTNTFQGGGTAFKTSTAVEELSATLGLGYSYGTDSTSLEFAYEADANDDDYLSHYGSIKIVGKF